MLEIDRNGSREWYDKKGELHREDGPAVEWNDGTKEWYRHGKLHRVDGPAIEYSDENKTIPILLYMKRLYSSHMLSPSFLVLPK